MVFSHVASTAAGNFGVPVVVDGFFYGRASGMAPKARFFLNVVLTYTQAFKTMQIKMMTMPSSFVNALLTTWHCRPHTVVLCCDDEILVGLPFLIGILIHNFRTRHLSMFGPESIVVNRF
ncbi:uncharacterized protein [Henckelia pumila]|uniref:uncharacterized protein isoform X2 n=1 Tax=Henckelia pumila TaxID=405737 RepID=UPI003C6DF2E6